jgi:hypothetical protein
MVNALLRARSHQCFLDPHKHHARGSRIEVMMEHIYVRNASHSNKNILGSVVDTSRDSLRPQLQCRARLRKLEQIINMIDEM